MKISDLVEELEKLKSIVGDVNVYSTECFDVVKIDVIKCLYQNDSYVIVGKDGFQADKFQEW